DFHVTGVQTCALPIYGTLNEVSHGIAREEKRPKVGIIPAGTTNDFARALRIPRDIKKAMDIILAGHSKKIDIGKANGHHFLNIRSEERRVGKECRSKW